jgi:antitoxin component YwqK of YwqJK toxin-antitoxin module
MLNRFKFAAISLLLIGGCKTRTPAAIQKQSLHQQWLDSLQQQSDTQYSRTYRNGEFVTADYFINRTAHTVCQIMRDSALQPRQVILLKNDKRIGTSTYYANGQLITALPLDSNGRCEGHSVTYYPDGRIKCTGTFSQGLYAGDWKYYSEKGDLLYTEQYDRQGQLVKTIRQSE